VKQLPISVSDSLLKKRMNVLALAFKILLKSFFFFLLILNFTGTNSHLLSEYLHAGTSACKTRRFLEHENVYIGSNVLLNLLTSPRFSIGPRIPKGKFLNEDPHFLGIFFFYDIHILKWGSPFFNRDPYFQF